MTVIQKFIPAVKKVVIAAAAVLVLAQCSEEDEMITPIAPAVVAGTSAGSVESGSLTSLTISGVNTSFATSRDCSTCTYIVPAGSTLVDGSALGLKPGDVVCLNSAFKYGALEFVNLEGTVEKPIVVNRVDPNATPETETVSATGDPY